MNIDVIGADRAPTEHDQHLLTLAQQAIQADPNFQHLQGAALSRCEINAGLSGTQDGYLYLRYDVPNAVPQEFWAHWGNTTHLNWKSGKLSIGGNAGTASS